MFNLRRYYLEKTTSHSQILHGKGLVVITLLIVAIAFGATGCALFQELQAQAQPPKETPTAVIAPVVNLIPDSGGAGTLITVVGGNWSPQSSVLISLTNPYDEGISGPIYASATVTEKGTFAATFVYPATDPWASLANVLVIAHSPETEEMASARFQILGVEPEGEATTVPPAVPPTDTSTPTPTPTTPSTPTSTPIPPTPTSTPDTRRASVTAGALNLRQGPGTGHGVITTLAQGTVVTVLGQNPAGNWLLVELSNGVQGWLARAYTDYGGMVPVEQPAPTPTFTPTPTPTPTSPGPIVIHNWQGEYFANTGLSGSPAVVRDDVNLDFNWGNGSPASGIPADNFSARWTRSLYFNGATYRFRAWVDDGVRVYVNNALVINAWYDGAPREVSGDISLGSGNHNVRVEYYDHGGGAQIRVWWERISDTSFPDWKAEYFDNRKLQGSPELVRNETDIDHNWGTGAPAGGLPSDNFSVRWTDRIKFRDGTYRFEVRVDDGVRLWLDDDLVIDAWEDGGVRTIREDIRLSEDRYDVKVEYYERHGGAQIEVDWHRRGSANEDPEADIRGPTQVQEGSNPGYNGYDSFDPDGDITRYEWDFDYHGSSFTVDAVGPAVNIHFPDGPAARRVALRVTDDDNEQDVHWIDVRVNNVAPQANAGGPYSGQAGAAINFVGSANEPGSTDRGSLTYRWEFGDGGTATGARVSHRYTRPGQYTARLTVTDKDGGQDADTASVQVSSLPNQPPRAVIEGPTQGLVGAVLNFNGSSSSDPDGHIGSYQWNFGDGATAGGVNVSHKYGQAGNYNVVLTVTDDRGGSDTSTYTVRIEPVVTNQPPVAQINGPASALVGEQVIFDSANSHDPDGQIVRYEWDYGDSAPRAAGSGESTVAHTYNAPGSYKVTLTVTDNGGLTATAHHTIVVQAPAPNQPPVAQISGPTRGTVGEQVIFDSANSHDPDGEIKSYVWNFGDSAPRTAGGGESTVAHVYDVPGTYQVSLTVTDNGGLTATAHHTIVIEAKVVNQPPVAQIHGPSNGELSQKVIFDSANSHDPDGQIVSYVWNFGDGAARPAGSGESTVAHVYDVPGTYQVSLTVTDNGGLTATAHHTIVIAGPPPNQPPRAVISGPNGGLVGNTLTFDGSASSDPDGSIVTFAWSFSDGATATGAQVSRTFNAPGSYNVVLTVTDNGGLSDTSTYTIQITQPAPEPPPGTMLQPSR